MASKTIRKEILKCLKNLSEEEFAEFKDALINDKGIPTSSVEKKNYLDVTNVVVQRFGDAEARDVVIKLLRANDCNKKADALDKATKELTSEAGSSQSAGASAGTDRVTPKADGVNFVDKYREELIQKVTNISQILDKLLTKKVIDEETYERIRDKRPSQEQMREIYRSLKVAASKNTFYEILVEKEGYLVDDLKQKE